MCELDPKNLLLRAMYMEAIELVSYLIEAESLDFVAPCVAS